MMPSSMTIQWANEPLGASTNPTPCACVGHVEGSHRVSLKVRTSPAAMFAMRPLYHCGMASARILHSSAREAVRPMVENRASSGRPSCASALSARSLVGSCPEAYSMSIRARGPVSMALPFQGGDLSQEELAEVSTCCYGGDGPEVFGW